MTVLEETRSRDDSIRSLVARLRASDLDAEELTSDLRQFTRRVAQRLEGRTPSERKRVRDRSLDALEPLTAGSQLLQAVRRRNGHGARNFDTLGEALRAAPNERIDIAPFDRFLLGTTPLSALRARRLFFLRELRYRLRRFDEAGPFRVLSLGTGPKSAILEFLRDVGPRRREVEATLIDADPKTLAAAERYARREGFLDSLRLIEDDPVRLALRPGAADDIGDNHFVYSPGLFDFLPNDLATSSLDFAHRLLRDGGQFAMAHYHHDLTPGDRLVLEWWLEWFPYFRSTRSIAKLLKETASARTGRAVGLVRGPNVYLVLERSSAPVE